MEEWTSSRKQKQDWDGWMSDVMQQLSSLRLSDFTKISELVLIYHIVILFKNKQRKREVYALIVCQVKVKCFCSHVNICLLLFWRCTHPILLRIAFSPVERLQCVKLIYQEHICECIYMCMCVSEAEQTCSISLWNPGKDREPCWASV